MTLNEDAVILNGPPPAETILQGCLSTGGGADVPGKSLETIATELTTVVHESVTNACQLTTNTTSDDATINANYRRAFQSLATALCLVTQWKSVHEGATTVASVPGPAMADAVAAAHAIVAKSEDSLLLSEGAAAVAVEEEGHVLGQEESTAEAKTKIEDF